MQCKNTSKSIWKRESVQYESLNLRWYKVDIFRFYKSCAEISVSRDMPLKR